MKACGACGAWIPDDAAACPNCSKAVGGAPAAPGVDAPPGLPGPGVDSGGGVAPGSGGGPGSPDGEGAAFFRRRAETRLRTLGTLYMVAGFLTLGLVAVSFYQNASGATLRSLEELERNPGPVGPELMRQVKDLAMQPWYLAVTHALPFLLGVFWAWSGSRLRSLEGRIPALVGAVFLLLPCTTCCCLYMPLGIYALVTLTRPDSESVFSARS